MAFTGFIPGRHASHRAAPIAFSTSSTSDPYSDATESSEKRPHFSTAPIRSKLLERIFDQSAAATVFVLLIIVTGRRLSIIIIVVVAVIVIFAVIVVFTVIVLIVISRPIRIEVREVSVFG